MRQRGKKCNLVSEFNSSVTEFFFLSANVTCREHLFIVADLRSLFNVAFVSWSELVICLTTKLHVPSDSCPLAIIMKPMKERTSTTYVILFDILRKIPIREFVCLSEIYHYTLCQKNTHTHLYVCMCVCVCVSLYIYIYIYKMTLVPVDFACPHKLSR